ncbi:MAG: hypothetical protein ACXWG1_07345 [Usitatibacter sp.]
MTSARKLPFSRCILLLASLWGSVPAVAQSTQLVVDNEVGVKLSIPKDWQSRSRGRDVFVDCAPGKGESGRPACYFTIERRKAPPAQKTITDADKAKWQGWTSAGGMRPIISTRDLTIAGFPAYEVLARSGTARDDPRHRRVFILVPGAGQLFDISFLAMGEGKGDQYDKYQPAVAAALETLAPAK